jgi:hypothetical protein
LGDQEFVRRVTGVLTFTRQQFVDGLCKGDCLKAAQANHICRRIWINPPHKAGIYHEQTSFPRRDEDHRRTVRLPCAVDYKLKHTQCMLTFAHNYVQK